MEGNDALVDLEVVLQRARERRFEQVGQKLKVACIDFWPGYQFHYLFFIESCLKRNMIEVSHPKDADLIIASIFGNERFKYKNVPKLLYSGENIRFWGDDQSDRNDSLYDITWAFLANTPHVYEKIPSHCKIYHVPYFLIEGDPACHVPVLPIKSLPFKMPEDIDIPAYTEDVFPYDKAVDPWQEKRKLNITQVTQIENQLWNREFCCFAAGNCSEANQGVMMRNHIFKELHKYKHVNSGGGCFYNTGFHPARGRPFRQWVGKHKFYISTENNSGEG
jgi:hypothetical protein